MPAIAVLDDRASERKTLMRGISSNLPQGWDCVECPIEGSPDAYPRWLTHNHIYALVVDQVLNEQASGKKNHATFKGHDVIAAIRKHLKSFPIYVITAYPEDDDLKDHRAEADRVLRRDEFAKNADVYVKRIVRAAERFAEEHKKDLSRLTDLARKAATNTISADERKELASLQSTIGFVTLQEAENARAKALDSLEKKLKGFQAIEKDIVNYLRKKKQ